MLGNNSIVKLSTRGQSKKSPEHPHGLPLPSEVMSDEKASGRPLPVKGIYEVA